MKAILYRAMDYNKRELLTIQMALGVPATGSVKAFNSLDQELEGLEKVIIRFDERSETYEADVVCNGKPRTVVIVGIEYAAVS
jgi:hypothetical protein